MSQSSLLCKKQKGSKADADIRYMTEEQFEKLSKDEKSCILSGLEDRLDF